MFERNFKLIPRRERSSYDVKVHNTNSGSIFYTIPNIDKGESSLQFLFYENRLEWIQISSGPNYAFPPFSITDEEKKLIKEKLNNIGGQKEYDWGSVSYNEDSKGGNVSIIVKYKT